MENNVILISGSSQKEKGEAREPQAKTLKSWIEDRKMGLTLT